MKILIFGNHGMLNFGDDAIIISLIVTLDKSLRNGYEFYIFANQNLIKYDFKLRNDSKLYFVDSFYGLVRAFFYFKNNYDRWR